MQKVKESGGGGAVKSREKGKRGNGRRDAYIVLELQMEVVCVCTYGAPYDVAAAAARHHRGGTIRCIVHESKNTVDCGKGL